MGITVHWDDDAQTIIRWDFENHWTWDEFREAFDESRRMIENITHRVDVIPNVTQTPHLPIGALAEFKRLDRQLPDTVKLIVVAGSFALARPIIALFKKVYRARSWHTAESVEAARAYILTDRQGTKDQTS